jgi:hypothetical protein
MSEALMSREAAVSELNEKTVIDLDRVLLLLEVAEDLSESDPGANSARTSAVIESAGILIGIVKNRVERHA